MAWTQTSEYTFERPLGEHETFMKLVGDTGLLLDKEHWAITATATFVAHGSLSTGGCDISRILRKAWQRLRFLQPSIAAYILDDKVMYEVPSSTDLDVWTYTTFVVASEKTTAADIIATRKPSPLAILYYLPATSELVFQTSHWRTDGIGVLQLLDVYFDIVCEIAAKGAESITWGDETSRLAPAIEEAANLSKDQSPELLTIAEKCVGTFALTEGQVGVKYRGDSNTPPASTRRKILSFSEANTTAIVNAAKSRGISVTSALHASVAATNYALVADKDDKSKPFTSTIRFSLRPYLPPPYNTHTYSSALYTSGYMYQRPSSQTWSQNAVSFNTEYRKGYSDIMPAHRQYARLLSDAIRNASTPTDPPPSNIDISSIGIVDPFIAPHHRSGDAAVEVTRVSVGVEFLNRQTVCMVWTFRGRLNLQLNYNDAYYTEEDVDGMLRCIADTTVKELGVGDYTMKGDVLSY